MQELVEITVDGKNMAVSADTTVLQALREHDIHLPALCYHPHLEAYGSCGLCLVEILNDDNWETKHACLLKVKDGLQIRTDTSELRLLRSWAAKIFLRHRPFLNHKTENFLLNLVQDEIKEKPEDENLTKCIKDLSGYMTEGCILCGLCVRMCSKIGKHHLTFLGKGKNLRISFVRGKSGETSCGNCRACCHVCPAGFITSNAEQAFSAKLY